MKYIIILLTLTPALANAWGSLDREFGVLNTDIRYIWSGGAWQHGEHEGHYRFLVAGRGFEHYKSALYVQWVADDPNTRATNVLRTIGIRQLNDYPVYSFTLPKCVVGLECGSLELDATHTYALTEHNFEIIFMGIGQYKFITK